MSNIFIRHFFYIRMNTINQIDTYISIAINKLVAGSLYLSTPLKYITHTSDGKIYLLYTILIPFIVPDIGLDIVKFGILAFSIQVPIYLLLKNRIKRERPSKHYKIIQIIKPPDKYSFPSGHCASSSLLTLIINLFIPTLTIYLIIWMCIICISRIGLGLHYFSDVMFGLILGYSTFKFSELIYSIYF